MTTSTHPARWTSQVKISVSDELHDELVRLAAEEQSSVSAFTRRLVGQALAAREVQA